MLGGRIGVAALLCTVLLVDAAFALGDVAGAAAAASAPRFSSAAALEVGMDPVRMVAADLNGDRKPDLATVDWNSATVSVLFGKGTGSFRRRVAYRTQRRPSGIMASDVDGDGRLDLVSTSDSGYVSVFTNLGSGRFGPADTYAAGDRAYAVAAADVNQDGVVDLVTAHYDRNQLTVLLGTGAGRFTLAHRYTGPRATDIAVGDLNQDGKPDVVLAAGGGNSVLVRLGLGDGTFASAQSYKSGSGPFGVTLADFNHDDLLDIAAANYGGGSVAVLLASGGGAFSERSLYPMGDRGRDVVNSNVDTVVVADFDRDGSLDVATPEYFRPRVRRGRGDGSFYDQRHPSGGLLSTVGGAAADFDRDGWPDLAFSESCNKFDFPPCPARSVYVFFNWTGQTARPCVVPDVRHERPRGAARQLRLAGCRLGNIRHRHSRIIRRGRLIRQRPRDGAVLPSHGRVDIVVSLGRRR